VEKSMPKKKLKDKKEKETKKSLGKYIK